MRVMALILLCIVVGVSLLSALNWHVIVASSELSLGVATVSMPMGLILLGVLGLVSMLFLSFVIYLQGSALLDARRLTKEVLASRDLADKAEASRFTELRSFVAETLKSQHEQVLARIAQLEHSSQTLTEQTGNALAASLGELEDRLERQLGKAAPPRLLP